MRLRCPECNKGFDAYRNPLNGNHDECRCECGQRLQWDWQSYSSNNMYGPPKECQHPDVKNDAARVPLYQ